jgi:choloylglycine hydrolase
MCTSFQLRAKDSTVVVGRTMEFPNLMGAKITAVPRGFKSEGVGPNNSVGKTWTTTHGYVGMDAFGHADWLTDGMNEKGVYAGLLYMPGFCDYTPADDKKADELIAIVNVVAFVLANCASVAEAKTTMQAVTVWPMTVPAMGFAPPAHVVLHDASGDSAVIEWVNGEMVIFDNPIGVATNSPHLDWHLLNLSNFVNLTPINPKPVVINGVTISPLGQGPGMAGLPADISAPSRFVRATAYVAAHTEIADSPACEMAAFHMLNNFDIPVGLVRDGEGGSVQDQTLWSTISNLTGLRYIVRGVDNPNPVAIDLETTAFDSGDARQIDLPTGAFATLTL